MKIQIPVNLLLIILFLSCTPQVSESEKEADTSMPVLSQDHLIMATLWYQKSAEMKALYYQAFNWAKIILQQNVDQDHVLLKSNHSSKKERRGKISAKYEILLLIGDNLNDFSEVFEDRSDNFGFASVSHFKTTLGKRFIILPNPMYGAWENALRSKGLYL